ncbi:MAG: HAMP domain-containing protein [Polyangiaceae bacterium]|nr:HAMP domain-containing protein [Polyangiaceae bacterium]
MIAFSFVAILATALVGVSLRRSTRQTIERDYDRRVDAAATSVQREFGREVRALGALLEPLCAHDTFVDEVRTALEKERGDATKIHAGKRSAWTHFVPNQAQALALDELSLVTGQGFVLAASDVARTSTTDARLGKLLRSNAGSAASWRTDSSGGAGFLEAFCTHGEKGLEVGLVGARSVGAILDRIGLSYGVKLRLAGDDRSPKKVADAVVRTVDVKDVPGMRVVITATKETLHAALAELDRAVLTAGAAALLIGLGLAVILARSLSRPIVELARETREVVVGEPRTIVGRGSRELGELANAYNRTIAELASIRKRLAAAERISARREVARQVAHEIKNPLAPIRAAVETLRRLRARDDPAFDEYFEEATTTVLQEVHRIANIVSEFTKFARLPPPKPESIDLVEVAKGVVTLHASAGEGLEKTGTKRVELKADKIPNVMADRDQMVQVLTNLVQNGLDAASAVRPDPRVVVTIDLAADGKVRIVVRDNGPGVPPEILPRLFEPYATSKEKGTGLGLAIVHRMVFEHGGEIMYREATKGGAVFEILLPITGPPLLDKPPAIDTTFRQDKSPS